MVLRVVAYACRQAARVVVAAVVSGCQPVPVRVNRVGLREAFFRISRQHSDYSPFASVEGALACVTVVACYSTSTVLAYTAVDTVRDCRGSCRISAFPDCAINTI